MNIIRVVSDIKSDNIQESRDFYAGFLGFQIAMDMDWVITFVSPSNPTAQITVMRSAESGAFHPQMSIEVDDVDHVHEVGRPAKSENRLPVVRRAVGRQAVFRCRSQRCHHQHLEPHQNPKAV
jgi:catechol 2,3-dioxygenase-like lactoylglutathione lyase family enzyme